MEKTAKNIDLKKKINGKFQRAMMTAPPVALNMLYYKETLEKVIADFKRTFPAESVEVIDDIHKQLQKEFTWFTSEESFECVQKFGGGYFRDMNKPKKLVGKALYEVLKITNNPAEQKKANKKFGRKKK